MYDSVPKVRAVSQKLIYWALLSNLSNNNFMGLLSGGDYKKLKDKTLELENIVSYHYQLESTFLTSVNLYVKHIIKLILLISHDTYIGYYSVKMKNLVINLHAMNIINLSMKELSPETFNNPLLTKEDKIKIQKIIECELLTITELYDFFYSKTVKEIEDCNSITTLFLDTYVRRYGPHPLTKTVLFIDKGIIGNKTLYKAYNIDTRALIKGCITGYNPITNGLLHEETCENFISLYSTEIALLSIYLEVPS